MELRSRRSVSLEDLIATVVEYNDSLEEQEFKGACRNILWKRACGSAQACIEAGG